MEHYEQRFMDLSAQEMLLGRTLVGPHLDDVDLRISGRQAKNYASSGQVRTMVLSVKLAVRDWVKQVKSYYPILLLDDIDAELDMERLTKLMNRIQDQGQSLISTSKYGTIGLQHGRNYMISSGHIERNIE